MKYTTGANISDYRVLYFKVIAIIMEEEACVLSNPLHPHNPTNSIPSQSVSANSLSSQIQRQMQMKRHDLTKAATMQRRIHVPSNHAKKGAHANTKYGKTTANGNQHLVNLNI